MRGVGLEGAVRQARPTGRGLGHRLRLVPVRRRAADLLERAAALGRAAAARSLGQRHRVLRRHRDRPGLGQRARRPSSPRCSASTRSTSASSPATPTSTPVDLGSYSLARDADDGQRRHRGRRAGARAARRGRRRQARAAGERGWCSPTGASSTASDPDARHVVRRGGAARRGAHGTLGTTGSYRPPKSPGDYKGARRRARRRPTRTRPPSSRSRSIARPAGCACRRSGSRTTSAARSTRCWRAARSRARVYMGLGEALMEEQAFRRLPPKLSRALVHKFPSMLEYKSPGTLDMPDDRDHPDRGARSERAVRRQGGRAGAAACRSCRRWPTRSTTPSACASTRCRSRRRRS